MERSSQQVLLSRRSSLMSLQKHPGWLELRDEVDRRKQRDMRALLSKALNGEEFENLKAQIDFLRGWEAALSWVTSIPEGAERSLERFLTREQDERASA